MLRAASLPKGSPQELATAWVARLESSRGRIRADGLYCGRSFVEAKTAAQVLGANFYIVSAGIGLVRQDAQVPAYGVTVSGASEDNVIGRMNGEAGPDAIGQWWRLLCRKSPVGERLRTVVRASSGLVLIALPSVYLSMIASDLAKLHGRSRSRLRIFTSAAPKGLPKSLSSLVMPYDERLDGPDSPMPGTRSDFAARALRHFVDHILKKHFSGDVREHMRAVTSSLARMRKPRVAVRARHSDEEIIRLIQDHWNAANGKSSRMLRVLRDDLSVACEQSRFAGLFRKAKRRSAG